MNEPTTDDCLRDLAADLAYLEALALTLSVTVGRAACRRALAAEAEVQRLQAAIRSHRDQRGDDRCWLDDETLYRVLPEGFTPPARDAAVELDNCRRFIRCRQQPLTEYVSPQRRIEQLEAEAQRLRGIVEGLADRVAAQSELLSRRAEAGP